jgi:hypothetical protein
MKAGREHRIPLSPRALAILRTLKKMEAGEFVFPGQVRNKPLSSMAMEMVLRRMKVADATVHGFRSSFRDWAGNVSNFPREITETALAHVIGDKAEQAYRRSDALEKRRKLMDAWAAYCEPKTSANVVQMRKQKQHSQLTFMLRVTALFLSSLPYGRKQGNGGTRKTLGTHSKLRLRSRPAGAWRLFFVGAGKGNFPTLR